jgi:hypothetical protein
LLAGFSQLGFYLTSLSSTNSNEILAFGPGADSWVSTVMSAGSTWYNYGAPRLVLPGLNSSSATASAMASNNKTTDRASRPSFLTVLGQFAFGEGFGNCLTYYLLTSDTAAVKK